MANLINRSTRVFMGHNTNSEIYKKSNIKILSLFIRKFLKKNLKYDYYYPNPPS